ncbi:Putrescine transport system permease protein PotH [Pseudovibrio axinellae]|uniref:Putrescine transport system permease protein PotH n=1 Tax=Pseudovibrio axinellae TaxID=989403 RepID=A0A165YIM4_9HYPH|nr:ABC transporter permease [Pseudovibrio axinellae]KZL18875.1 Putrescine transport system permease protein PotH [Pseudovibrio axinellae]SEP89461.1 spermidine/putrescine transport system permease protein [Pseudovibrio axinellae]
MNSLIKSYGKGLTALFVGLTVVWIAALIVLPQISMVDRAFTYEDRGGAAATLSLEIDRAYQEVFQISTSLDDLRAEKEALSSGGSAASQQESVSALDPFATPAPTPSQGVNMLDPFAAPSASGSSNRTAAQIEADEAPLIAKKSELEAKIVTLEAKEKASTDTVGLDTSYSLKNFTEMSSVHLQVFLSTMIYALCVTVMAFALCYPVAYAVATATSKNKIAILMLGLLIPYAINELLRIFAWVMILEKNGVLNAVLDMFGIIDLQVGEGFRFVASNGAVFTVMVYAYVLFMVFPIYNTIDTLDKNQIEAAKDLGASTFRIHWRVVLPHAKPGIAVGAIMTFMLSAGSIAVPEIVGRGLHPDWFSQVIYRRFFEADSWNQGAAYSLTLLLACVVFILFNMAVFRVGIRDIAK